MMEAMNQRVARLDHRALIRVEGAKARPFLNRLLTQQVETLAPGDLRYGALLTPQGRLLYDLFLFGDADGVTLDVDAEARAAIALRLNAYRLRAAVTVTPVEGGVFALWGVDDAPASWRRDPRSPAAGFRFAGDAPPDVGAQPVASAAYRDHRAALGLTDAAQDGLHDKAYATEANLDLANGVDFAKGCFVGQETTSRMKRRGGVRSRVLPVEAPGAVVGDQVDAGGRRAGEVVSAGSPALALLRLDRALDPLARPSVNGAPARVVIPDAWRDRIAAPALEPVA